MLSLLTRVLTAHISGKDAISLPSPDHGNATALPESTPACRKCWGLPKNALIRAESDSYGEKTQPISTGSELIEPWCSKFEARHALKLREERRGALILTARPYSASLCLVHAAATAGWGVLRARRKGCCMVWDMSDAALQNNGPKDRLYVMGNQAVAAIAGVEGGLIESKRTNRQRRHRLWGFTLRPAAFRLDITYSTSLVRFRYGPG